MESKLSLGGEELMQVLQDAENAQEAAATGGKVATAKRRKRETLSKRHILSKNKGDLFKNSTQILSHRVRRQTGNLF